MLLAADVGFPSRVVGNRIVLLAAEVSFPSRVFGHIANAIAVGDHSRFELARKRNRHTGALRGLLFSSEGSGPNHFSGHAIAASAITASAGFEDRVKGMRFARFLGAMLLFLFAGVVVAIQRFGDCRRRLGGGNISQQPRGLGGGGWNDCVDLGNHLRLYQVYHLRNAGFELLMFMHCGIHGLGGSHWAEAEKLNFFHTFWDAANGTSERGCILRGGGGSRP